MKSRIRVGAAVLIACSLNVAPAAQGMDRRDRTHPWVSWLHERKTYAGKLESDDWFATVDYRTERECLKSAAEEISALEEASRGTDAKVTRISRYKLRYEEKGNRYLIVSETACFTKTSKPAK